MKYLFALLALMLLSLPLFAAEPGVGETGQAWLKAAKANNLEAIVALYAPDAVMFPPDMMVAKGSEEIRKDYAGLLDHFTIQEADITDAMHETQGDLSTSWGQFRLVLKPKEGGDIVTMNGRFSDVSKRIKGKWLYIADHASLPAPPPPGPAK
jgi:uncharacterized protein (TIGR02246 family)